MKERKTLKGHIVFKALLMVVLIVSLPVVTAVRMYDVSAVGSSGVVDIVSPEDSVEFEIYIDLEGQEDKGVGPADIVAEEVVVIYGKERHVVKNCAWEDEAKGYIVCKESLNIDTSDKNSIYSYDVMLDTVAYSPKPLLYLDTTGPAYSDLMFSVGQSGNNITYDLSAKDTADSKISGKCSGLDKYEIYLRTESTTNGTGFTEKLVESGMFDGNCSDSVSSSFSITSSTESGAHVVCVRAIDSFGNPSKGACQDIVVDNEPPKFGEIGISNADGSVYNGFIKKGGQDIKVVMAVFENGDLSLVDSYVTVNNGVDVLTRKIHSYKVPLNSYNGSIHNLESELFSISGDNVSINVTTVVSDDSGNIATDTRVVSAVVDSTGPKLEKYHGRVEFNGTLYGGFIETINATLIEDGVGIYSEKLYLDIGGIVTKASYCNGSINSSTWKCVFEEIDLSPLSDGDNWISFTGDSTDDAGNIVGYEGGIPVSADANLGIIVIDQTLPVIDGNSINMTGSSQMGIMPVLSTGNTVHLEFDYKDSSPVTAVVNFSDLGMPGQDEISPSYNVVTASCEAGKCVVDSDRLGDKGGIGKIISIQLTDIVGNKASHSFDVKVLDVEDNASVWDVKTVASPKEFDREVSELMNQRGFLEFTLVTDIPDMTIVDVDFDQCADKANNTAKKVGGMEYIVSSNYVGESDDSYLQYVSIETKNTAMKINKIKFDCRFTVNGYSEDTLYPNQKAVAEVSLGLFNNPLDTPDQALQEKIDDAIEETEGMWEVLDEIYAWVKWLETICNIYSGLRGVITFVASVLGTLGILEKSLDSMLLTVGLARKVGATSAAGCKANQASVEAVDGSYLKYVDLFCQWVTCDLSIFGAISGAMDNYDARGAGSASPGTPTNDAGKATSVVDPNTKSPAAKPTFEVGKEVGPVRWYSEALSGGIGDWSVFGYGGEKGTVFDANNVKTFSGDSLLTQIIYLCIPGILKKAHEWRAIKCQYVLCLIETKDMGMGSDGLCESIKNNLECQFIFGEIFSMLPFSGLLSKLMQQVEQAATDYFTGLLIVAHWACVIWCKTPLYPGTAVTVCGMVFKINSYINSIGKVVKIVRNFDQWFDFSSDGACDQMEEEIDRMESESGDNSANEREDNTGGSEELPEGYGGEAA